MALIEKRFIKNIGAANGVAELDASAKLKLEQLPEAESMLSYGITWDTAFSALPARIGNWDLHRSLPIQSKMKGCVLNGSTGSVVYYLKSTDWTKKEDGTTANLDGTDGQVMVEIPAHYRKFTSIGTIRIARISEYNLTGYHLVPKTYISAYEASLERSTGKLCSVKNTGADYRGGTNTSAWDGTYRTLLQRPVTNLSRTQFRTAARLRAAGSSWNLLEYNTYKAVFWLYYIEYSNLNCQAAVNAQKDSNGCTQGGLGDGVTNISDWSGYNSYNPFVPCGASDSLGNYSGEVTFNIYNSDTSLKYAAKVNRYRGIENPFGHLWKWTDGINIEVLTDAGGGTSKVYVADSPVNFNDANYTNYTLRGLEARTSGYVKELIFGDYGEIMPLVVGGSSSTYWCDYHYTDISSSSLRGVIFGGCANYGAYAGFACAYSGRAPSSASADIGSRLCFIP